jgi:hypothetical protein
MPALKSSSSKARVTIAFIWFFATKLGFSSIIYPPHPPGVGSAPTTPVNSKEVIKIVRIRTDLKVAAALPLAKKLNIFTFNIVSSSMNLIFIIIDDRV